MYTLLLHPVNAFTWHPHKNRSLAASYPRYIPGRPLQENLLAQVKTPSFITLYPLAAYICSPDNCPVGVLVFSGPPSTNMKLMTAANATSANIMSPRFFMSIFLPPFFSLVGVDKIMALLRIVFEHTKHIVYS